MSWSILIVYVSTWKAQDSYLPCYVTYNILQATSIVINAAMNCTRWYNTIIICLTDTLNMINVLLSKKDRSTSS
nr:MAG TPA: hypothetical protein [Caudoviricetes sp.]